MTVVPDPAGRNAAPAARGRRAGSAELRDDLLGEAPDGGAGQLARQAAEVGPAQEGGHAEAFLQRVDALDHPAGIAEEEDVAVELLEGHRLEVAAGARVEAVVRRHRLPGLRGDLLGDGAEVPHHALL